MLKDAPPGRLLAAVRAAATGGALATDASVARRFTAHFTKALRPAGSGRDALSTLTGRGLGVLLLLTGGVSNGEIARRLVVEETTVTTHVSRILMDLGLRDGVQGVIPACETGLADPG